MWVLLRMRMLGRDNWLRYLVLSPDLLQLEVTSVWTLLVSGHRNNFQDTSYITYVHICQSIMLQLVYFWSFVVIIRCTFFFVFNTLILITIWDKDLMDSFLKLFLIICCIRSIFSLIFGCHTKGRCRLCSWRNPIFRIRQFYCRVWSSASLDNSRFFLFFLSRWWCRTERFIMLVE